MNKRTALLFSIIAFSTVIGQTKVTDSLNIQEFNYFYKDSVDNKVSFGDYEPTGFISLADGSLIVSTQFSISFDGQYELPDSLTHENINLNYELQKIFSSKSHVSSGSVFKLNSNFEKQWEIIFKEHRVMKIGRLPDQSVIVAGDRVDMEKFWMAHISATGKIIWQKEYKLKSSSTIANMIVDTLGNSFLLVQTERQIPISIAQYYGKRRIMFFRQTEMEGNIYLLKVSNKGKVLWTRSLNKRKGFQKFGHNIFLNKNIFTSASYEGSIKQKDKWIEKKGETTYEVNTKGKIINATETGNHFLYHYNDKYFSCTTTNDTLVLYTNTATQPKPTDTIPFINPVKGLWIYNSLTTKDNIYLLGSKDHNLGYIVVQLNKDNKYISYWSDNRAESCELVDAIVKSDGTIIIIGKCFKRAKGTNNSLTTYINLTIIKKNGT